MSPNNEKNRPSRRCIAITVIASVIAIAILIPTVFLPLRDALMWTRTSLDIFTESELLTPEVLSSGDRPTKNYGEYIALSASGDRMVVSSDLCEGQLQVWDYINGSEWVFKARFAPHEGTEYSYYPEGLDISDDGRRIIYSSKGLVRVFEDTAGTGTEWAQVGETLDAWSFATIYDFRQADYHSDDRSYGETVSLSSNGSIIAVAAPYSLDDQTLMQEACYGPFPDAPGCLSAVQVFQHADTLPESALDAAAQNNKTWIPRGQLIFDENEVEFFGRDVHLSSDGKRLVVALRGRPMVSVYNFDGKVWQKSQVITNGLFHGAGASLSRDGQMLAVRYGNVNSLMMGLTLWFDKNVHMYQYDDTVKEFTFRYTIKGVPGGEKYGTAMALSNNYDLAIGSTYEPVQVFEYHEDAGAKWKRRFELWKGRKTAAINADGTVIASGAVPFGDVSVDIPYNGWNAEFCNPIDFRGGDNGLVQVYDRR